MMKLDNKVLVVIGLILVVALARIIPHTPNYSPMTALALFGAVHFNTRWKSILVVFLAGFLSDIILNNTVYAYMNDGFTVFYDGFVWQYIGYGAIIALGVVFLKRITPLRVLLGALCATILFFVISNFGAWVSLPIYTKDMTGLMTAYTAGLPFLKMSFLSDIVYSAILFGGYAVLQRKFTFLQTAQPKAVAN